MAESIISLFASVIGWLAAFGIDAILGKWVAYFTIAWETKASDAAKKAAAEAVAEFKKNSEPNYTAWRELRRAWRTKDQSPSEKAP